MVLTKINQCYNIFSNENKLRNKPMDPYVKAHFNEDQVNEFYTYLDGLRESGSCNMFGSSEYLAAEFEDLSDLQARKIVSSWMTDFKSRQPGDVK